MKNTNIAESVYRVNLEYVILQNKTKELFFQCLQEGRDSKYFQTRVEQLWNGVDHSFLEDEISSYEEQIHENNLDILNKKESDIKPVLTGVVLSLIPIRELIKEEDKFINQKEKEYTKALNSIAYRVDKEEYLKLKVQKYTNQIVPYYSRTTGKKIRDVELSTYASMIHNTNLTRTGWNVTLNDAILLNQRKFIIPYHSFSCPYCIAHQNKVMDIKQVMDLVGHIEEQEGDILHPNCKCVLTFYDKNIDYATSNYSSGELEEQYQIRQKVNSLTLQKEKVRTDMRIQERLGNEDEYDKLNSLRNKLNKEIRNLQEALPTTELRKQVVVINR